MTGTGRVGQLALDAVAALEAAGVTACVLRGLDGTGMTGRDVDLLVASDDLLRTPAVLSGLGFASPDRRPGRPHRRAGGLVQLFGFDEQAGRWIQLDVTDRLQPGGIVTLPADAVLRRAVDRDGVPRPAPDDDFWIGLLHALLDRRAVRPDEAERLRLEAARRPQASGIVDAVFRSAPAGWSPGRVVELAAQGDWAALRRFAASLGGRRGRLRRRAIRLRRRMARAIRPAAEVAVTWFRGAPRRGLIVAVLGPDGIGKSTICEMIEASYVRPARTVKIGLGDGIAAPGARRRSRSRRLQRLRRLLLVAITSRVAAARGELVLFDRHPLEERLIPETGRGRGAVRRRLGAILPAVDAVVVLDAPATAIHARKPELDLPALERLRERYAALDAAHPAAELVDASGPPDAVRRSVVAAIWRLDRRRMDPAC